MKFRFVMIGLLLILAITFVPAYADGTTACPGFLPSRLVIGESARVLPDLANRLREQASTASEIVSVIPVGTIVNVLDGPVCDPGGIAWWQVDYQGTFGWTAEGQNDQYWLEPVAGIRPDNAMQGVQTGQIGSGFMTTKVLWLPDGTIAVGGDAGIWLFNGDDLSVPPRLMDAGGYVHFIAVTSDHKTLIGMVCSLPDEQHPFCDQETAHFWDLASFTETRTTLMEGVAFGALTVSVDSSMIAAGMGKEPQIWDLQTGKRVGFFFQGAKTYIDVMDFSPTGFLLGGTGLGETLVWSMQGEVTAYNVVKMGENIKDLTSSPDGSFFFAANSNATVMMLDMTSGKLLRTMDNNAGIKDPNCVENCREADGKTVARDLMFSPDGTQLASANSAGTLTLWDVASGELLQVIESGYKQPLFSVAFSPDGKRLVTNAINKDQPNNTIAVVGIGS